MKVLKTNPGPPPSDKIQFLVIDEDKLCLLYPGRPWEVEILATKASAMLHPFHGTYPSPFNLDCLRLATKEDFESFRVKLEQWPADEFELPES